MAKSPPAADPARSYTMSRIKSKDTSIEVALRKALWRKGIRYRKNYSCLPGVPDIAITKHKIAIFCDGEFWHGRGWSEKKPSIKHNKDYWMTKIEKNMGRDREIGRKLKYMDWMVIRFWGEEISGNLDGCVREIEHLIFQSKMEACATDWAFDDL
ncbi:MAG: very short patch repair endonuclease [Holophagales bacterium]|nr:very short patch repair endonuclease [Holophagales bacterium]